MQHFGQSVLPQFCPHLSIAPALPASVTVTCSHYSSCTSVCTPADHIYPSSRQPNHHRHPSNTHPALTPKTTYTTPSVYTPTMAKDTKGAQNNNNHEQTGSKKYVMSRKLCIICTENVAANQFPKLPHKQDGATEHSSDTCFKCFRQHLDNEIKFKGHDAVTCPQCTKPLDQSEIRKTAPSFSYQK